MNRRYRAFRSRSRHRAPKRKQLTAAQLAADDKRFAEATHTVEGRFTRNQLVTDRKEVYRITTYGRRYHEDVETRLYGAIKARAHPAEWTATETLRTAIDTVLKEGTHEPGSRGSSKRIAKMPGSIPQELIWTDSLPGRLSSNDHLTVHGDYTRAVRPICDDAPQVAWIKDAALVASIREAFAIAPEPFQLAEARVQSRDKKPAKKDVGSAKKKAVLRSSRQKK